MLWRLRDRLSAVQLFGAYLLLAGVERFLIEFIRRNTEVVAGLTQPQVWAAAMALGGIALLVGAQRRARATAGTASVST